MSAPIKSIQSGKVSLSVWENNFDGQTSYSYTIQKSYKDKEGKWQRSGSFGKQDLKDIHFLVNSLIMSGLLKKLNETAQPAQPPAPPASEGPANSEIPF